jgi:hypothetical protein
VEAQPVIVYHDEHSCTAFVQINKAMVQANFKVICTHMIHGILRDLETLSAG